MVENGRKWSLFGPVPGSPESRNAPRAPMGSGYFPLGWPKPARPLKGGGDPKKVSESVQSIKNVENGQILRVSQGVPGPNVVPRPPTRSVEILLMFTEPPRPLEVGCDPRKMLC